MKRFFVTGGAGFIGSWVCQKLLERNCAVKVFDSFQNYNQVSHETYLTNLNLRLESIADVERVRASLNSYDVLLNEVRVFQPTHIIHLAANPLSQLVAQDPAEGMRSIMDASLNLLLAANETPSLERFLYVSSSMVYGDFKLDPVPEISACEPKDIYGCLKLNAEQLTRTYCRKIGLEFVIARLSAVYGPGDNNRRVIQGFFENAMAGQALHVNGRDTRLDFSYVEDVAEGLVAAALSERAGGQVFNLTRGEGRSILKAAQLIKSHLPKTKIEIAQPDQSRPKRGALDIRKAKEAFGYHPKVSLEEGIERYSNYLLQQEVPKSADSIFRPEQTV